MLRFLGSRLLSPGFSVFFLLLPLPLSKYLLSLKKEPFHDKLILDIASPRKVLVPMAIQADALYHFLFLFILSIMIIPLKRNALVAFLLVLPALTEIAQFFMPSRVPDLMDAFHGYLGIVLAYSLVQMWREIAPVVRGTRH